jgi:hypothetical protein
VAKAAASQPEGRRRAAVELNSIVRETSLRM